MARLNQWSFRGQILNGPNVRIRDISGAFGLPPVRGSDFLTYGRTGQLFVPKLHDSRDITLEIIVRDSSYGVAAGVFDQLALLFANRAQGALCNLLDTGPRTGQAECTGWLPQDMSVGGTHFKGIATFHLADPMLYGATVTATTAVTASGTASAAVVNNQPVAARANFTLAITNAATGQPIWLAFYGTSHAVSTVTDTFSTPYTWTKLGNSGYYESWIGTGGAGTSGTITVTPTASDICGGLAVPLRGCSTSAGAGAVQSHSEGVILSDAPGASGYSVTPSPPSAGQLYLASVVPYPYPTSRIQSVPRAPWRSALLTASGGYLAGYGSMGAGLAVRGDWVWSGLAGANQLSAYIKTSGGAPTTLTVTNPGNVRAERMTLTFTGQMYNVVLYNATNGWSLSYTDPANGVISATNLVIDTGACTAMMGTGNAIGYVSHSGGPGLFALEPGANALTIVASSTDATSNFAISFATPWI